ncbi:MAG TPA: DUF3822 family protein [Sphingobacteriaceae bacterium]
MNTKLQLTESTFGSQSSSKCDLLLQIGVNNISYAVIEKGPEQLRSLCEVDGTLKDLEMLVAADATLGHDYRKVKISVDSTRFTFIPQEVFSEFYIENYAKFIQPASTSDLLLNDIRAFSIKNLIAVESEIQNLLKKHFPTATIFGQATPFIEGCWKVSKETEKQQLFINLRPRHFEAVIIKEEQLLFYNIFECQLPDEFNYFLLLLIRQFGLEAVNTKVMIAGTLEADCPFYPRLKKYFDDIQPADAGLLATSSETFELISLQPYFSLLSLNLCE